MSDTLIANLYTYNLDNNNRNKRKVKLNKKNLDFFNTKLIRSLNLFYLKTEYKFFVLYTYSAKNLFYSLHFLLLFTE